ncbi:MAG: redoxin domain-containing protein [Nevskiaceae bacterium]|nr:MAG: redoxin domain-containing protein [Nevskiaceae bacterium]
MRWRRRLACVSFWPSEQGVLWMRWNGLRLLALLAMLLGAPARAVEPEEPLKPWDSGMYAPAFSLKTPEGKTLAFPEFAAGKPVVLMFWPAWDPYSRALQPYLHSIRDDYRAAGVEVWMISVRAMEGVDPVRMLRQRRYRFPLLLDGDPALPLYRVEYTPWVVVVDGQRNIVYTRPPKPPSPASVAADIRKTLNELLGGQQAVPLPKSYPPSLPLPVELGGQGYGSRPLPPLPQEEWLPWLEQYLAGVPASEFVAGTPRRGAVANGKAAIAIARGLWTQAYGEVEVLAQAPYRAYRLDNQWVVLGSAASGKLGDGLILVIEQDSGRVQRIERGN